MSCVACQIGAHPLVDARAGFLAGVAFVLTYSDDAMRRRLCKACQEELLTRGARAAEGVRQEERRRTRG